MKRVLVTGAAGNIGINVIKYLLSEGKYEITALDLLNKKNQKRLKRYQRRINVVYGDITDIVLIDALIKTHDVIIHLAGVNPAMANILPSTSKIVDYDGTETIIKSINYYNKNCHLIYASSTSMYDDSLTGNIKEHIKENSLSNYSLNKYKTELLIKSKLKNYTILRLPLVLTNNINDLYAYNIKNNSIIEVSTVLDVGYAFVKSIDHQDLLNKKTYNVGMGKNGIIRYGELINNIIKYQGLSFKYIVSRLFLDNDYYSPILSDSDELDNIIHYRNDSLSNYFKRVKNNGKKRRIITFLSKPILFFMKKRIDSK